MNTEESTETSGRTITVSVFSPNQVDPKQFTWTKTMKVGEAADEAARAFGYDITGDPPTFMNAEGKLLDRKKPLVAEHVEDGDRLELVAGGGGV